MNLLVRKVAVINAATAWAEAIREHGPEAARPFRANFLMALDDALTATDRGAVEALERIRDTVRISSVKKHAADRCEEIAVAALTTLRGQSDLESGKEAAG
jgi:hypothetical protein